MLKVTYIINDSAVILYSPRPELPYFLRSKLPSLVKCIVILCDTKIEKSTVY